MVPRHTRSFSNGCSRLHRNGVYVQHRTASSPKLDPSQPGPISNLCYLFGGLGSTASLCDCRRILARAINRRTLPEVITSLFQSHPAFLSTVVKRSAGFVTKLNAAGSGWSTHLSSVATAIVWQRDRGRRILYAYVAGYFRAGGRTPVFSRSHQMRFRAPFY